VVLRLFILTPDSCLLLLASRLSHVTESARLNHSPSLAPERSFPLFLVTRHVSPGHTSLARIILATMLTLVMLAGVVPFSSLASSHECGMACCAGKPSHMAGSCSTAFSTEEEAAPDDEHSAHGHAMHLSSAASETNASAKQHGTAKHSSAHHSTSGVKSTRTARVVSQATLTTPCSPECAAAAPGYSQVRRPRAPASLMVAARLHPPLRRLCAGHFTVPIPQSAEARRILRPRAPPSPLNNLSA
jgi:hypothetical protein